MNFKAKSCLNILIIFVLIITLYFISERAKNIENLKTIIKKVNSAIDKNVDGDAVDNMKYLLIWTNGKTYPFIYLKEGQEAFKIENCEFTNCYVTDDKNFLPDIKMFDVLLFHIPEYIYKHKYGNYGKPDTRSPDQRYVIVSIESSDNYPTCSSEYNDFFNWTWTYKLDSDVLWNYIGVRDLETGKIVGPKVNMHWRQDMDDLSEEEVEKLKTKNKAAAWFVSNCRTNSKREQFARSLAESMAKYDMKIDIYGKCGPLTCERDSKECFDKMENDYYFYLAFENSFAEDYVTEKFVHPMKHRIIPIVWGGSNYTRFAPPGSYINAREMKDADELAKLMDYLIKNPKEYAKYLRWTKYYAYQRDVETNETQAFCNLCKALNDPVKMAQHKSYSDIKSWWNGNQTNYC